MPHTLQNVVRSLFEEGWNKGDMAAVEGAYSRSCISYDITSGVPERNGSSAQVAWVQSLREAIPDLTVTLHSVMASGDRAVTRWVARGTQRGELCGLPSAGKKVAWGGITIQRFLAGKIQEEWVAADLLAVVKANSGSDLVLNTGTE